MNSLELVRRAIHFQSPERLPFTGSMTETDFSGDTVAVIPSVGRQWWLGEEGADEWGCLWKAASGHGDMGQVSNVLVENLRDLSPITVPDAAAPERYAHWPKILDRAEGEGKYVVCCNGSFLFERAHFLHGFENTLMDMAMEPDAMRTFLEAIAEYHMITIQYIARNFRGRVHGYRGTDDWGTQSAPIISPAIFADMFLPIYQKLFEAIHDAGMDVWMHSCGQVLEILPLLIEAGLNVVNLTQPNIFPIHRLAEFKGRICFEMCADEQTTLPNGDRNAIATEIRAILATCRAENGGFIEMTLNRMHYEGDGIPREIGEFCHSEYRKLAI